MSILFFNKKFGCGADPTLSLDNVQNFIVFFLFDGFPKLPELLIAVKTANNKLAMKMSDFVISISIR